MERKKGKKGAPAMPPSSKKKTKGFGSFSKAGSMSIQDDASNILVDISKASETIKELEAEYTEKGQQPKLTKKFSSLAPVATWITRTKSYFNTAVLSENYLEFAEDVYQKLSKETKAGNQICLDWTGLENMNDAVFGCLLEKPRIPAFDQVLRIILTGCYRLTDIGIGWMAQCFPNLKDVAVDGCFNVTETGIYHLEQKCNDLTNLDLTATGVTILPTALVNKEVDTAGCGLISPSEGLSSKDGTINAMKSSSYKKPATKNMVKVCIIQQQGSIYRIMPMITGEQDKTKSPVNYKGGLKLGNEDVITNAMEFEEGMLDKFVSKRSVIVVSFDGENNKEETISWLTSVYCQILEKTNKAYVIFLALGKDDSTQTDAFKAGFIGEIKNTMGKLKKHKETILSTKVKDPDKNPLGRTDQMIFVHTKQLLEALEQNSSQNNYQFIAASKANIQKKNPTLNDELKKGIEKTISLYPEYEEISHHMFQYICSDNSTGMFKGNNQSSSSGILSLEGTAPTTHKTMECLHYFGKLIFVDNLEDYPLVIDIEWLSALLSAADNCQANFGRMPHVSETTSIVMIDELNKKFSEMKQKEKNPVGMLTKLGLGLSNSQAFLGYRNLENEPPIPITDFIGQDTEVQQVRYSFCLFHSVTPDIMAEIFNCAAMIRRPIMSWKNGMSLQENLAQVVIQHKKVKAHKKDPNLQLEFDSNKYSSKTSEEILSNFDEGYVIEVLVQSSKDQKGDLKTIIPKVLTHASKKFKLIVEYVLMTNGIPYKLIETNNLATAQPDIQGIVSSHKVITREDGAILCSKCGMAKKQIDLLWKLRRIVGCGSKLITQVGDQKEATTLSGDNVLNSDLLVKNVKNGEKLEPVVINTSLNPFRFNRINFILLDEKNHDEIRLDLCDDSGKSCISYSFKTGQVCHSGVQKSTYQKDPLGKVVELKVRPVFQEGNLLYKFELAVNGERQLHGLFPKAIYKPRINFGTKKDNMKSLVMIHAEGSSGAGSADPGLKVGMRLEALDRKTPGYICVANIKNIYDDGRIEINFDGWTERYDYIADPSSDDLHPIGWFAANRGQPYMRNYTSQLQKPNRYHSNSFDWLQYCKELNFLPVPIEFFNEEQKGVCDGEEIQSLHDYLGIDTTPDVESTPCSQSNFPGFYNEVLLLNSRDKFTDEMVEFYSNHRQFLCLLPQKFDVNTLRFPSLPAVMNIEKQNVHFICPGNRMELLHLVDHKGLPLHHYIESDKAQVDVGRLYAFLEMIYLGLVLQDDLLPNELGTLCPGVDSSSEEKLGILELGFKRIFIQYLLWIYTYNKATFKPTKPGHTKMERSTVLPEKILKDEKSVMSLSSKFEVTGSTNIIRCHGHANAISSHKEHQGFNTGNFETYAKFMTKFELQGNKLEELPENFFTKFQNLTELNVSNNLLKKLPEGISSLWALEKLDVSCNELSVLPKDILELADTLTHLNISSNSLNQIPAEVFKLENLQVLKARNIGEVSLRGIGALTQLEELVVGCNVIKDVHDELMNLPLTSLDLSGVQWFPNFLEQNIQPNLNTFKAALNEVMVFKKMSEEEKKSLFAKVDKDANGILDHQEIKMVNDIIYEMFPRFGFQFPEFPPVIWKLKTLKRLELQFHGFKEIPDDVQELEDLTCLNVSHNPALESLSGQLGGLPLTEMHLKGCPSLKTPPKEIVDRGFSVVYGYLRRLQQGSVQCKRTKLMVVGLGGAGKTSLIRSLTQGGQPRSQQFMGDHAEKITDGIDITTWNVPVPGTDSNISYSVWDFAGQTVYYNTHQFFLSNRAVYLLLWNIRLGYEHAGLEFWLSSIACHAPKAPILVVGTHCDKVKKSKIPQKELMAIYPQIAGFHFVSSYTGEGLDVLYSSLRDVTLEQKYMGESIPEAWLSFEKKIIEKRDKKLDLIPYTDVKALGAEVGILEESEIIQAVQFLHDLGSLQFFNTEFLRSLVVIVPQWIVDVMACVVTVHVGPIQEGKLLHKDMAVIWKQYPKELHPWLLRLTEEFDLTFPLSDEEANLVPCLLPDNAVEVTWPAIEEGSGVRETKAIYNFKYLPAGLFNRAQVRLHQFAESGQLWKKGMFLKKNNHISVVKQKGQTMLEVRVQGFRPENILFLVDEVISTLIVESYSGVNYDLMVPCTECQNLGMVDPSMFQSSKIHRAVELNAPFLQCDKMFHVLSITELKALLPPNKTSEFDDHLRRSVIELKDLGEDININVVFCYSKKNVPSLQDQGLVHPGHIIEDLRKDGFNVSICDNPETADVESLTIAFKAAQVILFGVSDEFCADETCKKLLIFVKETLNKPILLVVLGKTLKFLETSIGLNISDEVFVKMTDAKRYEPKIKEMKEALKKKRLSTRAAADLPQCFISYCWSNSNDAVSKGSAKLEGALGSADPREIAKNLQEKKIGCWLDIQRVGNVGLFDDIADGLRKAKVVVACVSDEYANSKNCKMEFRFAVSKLRIPTILAVVGTGYEWERSEIGMLAVGSKCPKINFQVQNEAGYLQLFTEIQKYVNIQEEKKTSAKDEEEVKKKAFGEILESAERQFLRHLMKFKEKSFTADYPRLVVIDLAKQEEKKEETNKKEQSKEESKDERDEVKEQEEDKGRQSAYCFTLLCESEEGWHDVSDTIPFPCFENSEEEENYLAKVAPYAARMNSILKYSGNQMALISTPAGKQLQDKLESHASTVTSEDDVEKAYNMVNKDVTEIDEEKTYGGLQKTSLLNGKTLWLCDEHRQKVGSITEKRYKTQLKPSKEEPKAEKPKKPTETAKADETVIAASSSLQPPSNQGRPTTPRQQQPQTKANVFPQTKKARPQGMKRQTSQACSVM